MVSERLRQVAVGASIDSSMRQLVLSMRSQSQPESAGRDDLPARRRSGRSIFTSITATSGTVERASSTASTPSLALAQISNPSRSSSAQISSRMIVSSSATRTLNRNSALLGSTAFDSSVAPFEGPSDLVTRCSRSVHRGEIGAVYCGSRGSGQMSLAAAVPRRPGRLGEGNGDTHNRMSDLRWAPATSPRGPITISGRFT